MFLRKAFSQFFIAKCFKKSFLFHVFKQLKRLMHIFNSDFTV